MCFITAQSDVFSERWVAEMPWLELDSCGLCREGAIPKRRTTPGGTVTCSKT